MTDPAQEIVAQNTEEQLKDLLKKLMSDGSLSDFLKKEMKATMEQMICEKGQHAEAFRLVNAKIDKGKDIMYTLGLFKEDEYYKAMWGAPQPPPTKLGNLTKSES